MLVTPDLMESSVLHGVGVVVIINDLKIFNSVSFGRSFELHLWFSLSCSLREDGEMGWNIDLNACKTWLCQLKQISLGLKVLMLLLTPTCLVQSRPFSTDFASIMRRIHLDFEWTSGDFLC